MLYSQNHHHANHSHGAPNSMDYPLPPPPTTTRRPKPPPENKKSILLSEEENKTVFELLGKGKQTLSTAVAQLLVPTPDQSRWTVRESGVLCFVRDTTKKSYFIQVFSLRTKTMIFRQEIYNQFDYKIPQPWFITFEGDNSTVGLNFADHVEAVNFKEVLDNKLETKRHRRNGADRRSRIMEDHQNYGLKSSNSGPNLPQSYNNGGDQSLSNGGVGSSPYFPTTTSLPNVPVPKSSSTPRVFISSKKLKKKDKSKDKDKKSMLRKEDIGKPMDFRHVQHVGWDPASGFALDGTAPDVTDFFQRIGVSSSQLEDTSTREFIYNFIENYQEGNVKETISGPIQTQSQQTPSRPLPPTITQQNQSTPPPVPVRHSPQLAHGSNKPLAPPPPPVRSFIPPPPSQNNQNTPSQPPPRPAPIKNLQNGQSRSPANTNGPAPPPPPPPPPVGIGAPPPPPPPPMDNTDANSGKMNSLGSSEGENDRSDLLKQIQQGVSLKKVDPEAAQRKSGGGGGLSDCLNQIKTGVDLKKTLVNPKIPQSAEALDGLAGALARALAARSKAINPDSSSSEDEEEEGFEDDEWE